MRPLIMRPHWMGVGILLGVLLGGMNALAQVSGPTLPEAWTAVRQALEKYQDPIVAVRDGYHSTLGCVAYPSGGMGIHFLNRSGNMPLTAMGRPR